MGYGCTYVNPKKWLYNIDVYNCEWNIMVYILECFQIVWSHQFQLHMDLLYNVIIASKYFYKKHM